MCVCVCVCVCVRVCSKNYFSLIFSSNIVTYRTADKKIGYFFHRIHAFIYIYIYIYISCHAARPSLATSPYRSSPLAGRQGYISYPHRAAVCMFELVILLLLSRMWGSIGVHHSLARPCFSSSVLHVWFV